MSEYWRSENPEGDWPEDFADDNGRYMHICKVCGNRFVGYKRRPPMCRVCAKAEEERWKRLTPEQQRQETDAAWERIMKAQNE